jgi:integrase
MAVFKRKGSQYWTVKFIIRGVQVYRTIPEARTKAEAQKAETAIRAEFYAGKYGESVAPLFAKFVEGVYVPWAKSNKRSYDTADAVYLKPLLKFFGKYRLTEISPFLVERYKQQRKDTPTHRGKPRKPSSVNRELECLSKVFSLAVDNNVMQQNPSRKVRKLRAEPGRERYLTPDEEVRLMLALEESPVHLKRFVILSLETGLRKGELLGLTVNEVGFVTQEIRMVQSKTLKTKTIPLSSRACEVLREMAWGWSGLVLHPADRFFEVADVKRSFASACKRAGIENFKIHDLRHTAATRWRAAGADEFTVMRLLGHTRVQTSAIYAHSTKDEMRAVVEAAGCCKPTEVIPIRKRSLENNGRIHNS